MIKLILVFIIIYISFMAIAINYAKAFRVKNGVINILEQHKYAGGTETCGDVSAENKGAFCSMNDYLNNVSYNLGDKSEDIKEKCKKQAEKLGISDITNNVAVSEYGVCLISMTGNATSPRYYMVTTYIAIDFPLFNISMILPVSGETKSIY